MVSREHPSQGARDWTILWPHSITEFVVVELVIRVASYRRVHPVLDEEHLLRHLMSDPSVHRDPESSFRCLFIFDDWSELLVVSNQTDMLNTSHYWDESLWLTSLSCLIHQHEVEFDVASDPSVPGSNTCCGDHVSIL